MRSNHPLNLHYKRSDAVEISSIPIPSFIQDCSNMDSLQLQHGNEGSKRIVAVDESPPPTDPGKHFDQVN